VPAAELEPTGDPTLRRPAPADPAFSVVEAAAVAVHEPALGHGDQLTQRRDPVPARHLGSETRTEEVA
jgi:hypothetical protein